MKYSKGPWVGMTPEQAKAYILRAAVAFKATHEVWPSERSGRCSFLLGADWRSASAYLRRVCATQLIEMCTGVRLQIKDSIQWPKTRRAMESLVRKHGRLFHEKHGFWPSHGSGRCESFPVNWSAFESHLRRAFGSSLPVAFGKPPRGERMEAYARSVKDFFTKHGRWPCSTSAVPAEKFLATKLQTSLRTDHPDLCTKYGLPLRARNSNDTAQEIRAFFDTNGRWPSAGATCPDEVRLTRLYNGLRSARPDVCAVHGLPLTVDRSGISRRAQGKEQFTALAVLAPRLAQNWRAIAETDISGDKGAALSRLLTTAHTRASRSRGFGYAPDLCQVTGISRFNDEIEADCWRFTIKGARKPDRRPWADILASGDNTKIESAERIAFLDWENPDNGAPLVGVTRGRVPATRRPWPPPITQPEAGKPAPAKGKGKRARAKA